MKNIRFNINRSMRNKFYMNIIKFVIDNVSASADDYISDGMITIIRIDNTIKSVILYTHEEHRR